jgi:crotonobetainyl-CoA:carnitine CoA-transferase CaiB-like acyl-CoA transferase
MFTEIEHPIEGKLNQFGIPIKLSETPGEIKSPPPVLGQHTEEVLLDLGYHKEDIERLREAKVI